jgi:hypothetical protein
VKGQVREDQVLVESDLVFWDHRGVQILRDLRGYSARSYLNFQANCVRRRFPWTGVRLHMFVVCLFVCAIDTYLSWTRSTSCNESRVRRSSPAANSTFDL